ncbi:BTB/POZ and MATH domain-containing protein 2-like [Lolium perenne]|jgi:speckle-type POZ protein|uniref:BTB/POZ and MATH domain-containing protein 2-like n=1 Tax=Lolium perenne TaxID=4522 RepID=UPI0021F5A556|nr:BTB/POZ and MATH domain-containing protein 2-like [Lolium perenne]
MAFAGVSLIVDGELCDQTMAPIDARADRGYHMLVIEGYSRSKDTPPTGEYIKSRPFLVGGHRWRIDYYPNGFDEDDEEFIAVFLVRDEDVEGQEVKAQAVFSFIDQPEFRMSTRVRKCQIPAHRRHGEKQFIRRDTLEASSHLKDDSFIIRCDVVVINAPADASTDKVAGETPPSDMQSHLSNLLLSDEGADITFKVGGQTFPAHRCVLAARSSVFKEQLFGATTVTKSNIVEINDMEAEIFYALLVFIYTDSFPDWDRLEDEEDDESGEEEEGYELADEYAMWLLQLIEAADRYALQRLKLICAEQLVEYTDMDRVADIIVVAERRQCRLLKDSCVELIKSHSSLYTVFTVDSLDQIIRTCSPSVLNELLSKFAT